MNNVRQALSRGLSWFGLLALCASVQAADYPSKTIRIIVPFAPGGVVDTTIRNVTPKLSERLGQSIVIENRPGANGSIAALAVVQAPADGYTLLAGFDGTLVINPHVYTKLSYDSLRDFVPITKVGNASLVLAANPNFKYRNLRDLLLFGKSNGEPIAYGTSGTGSTTHLAGELLSQRTGLPLQHVPYKGGGPAVTDAVAGQIPLVFTGIASALQFIKSGRLIALGVSDPQRSAALPSVPTFIESGVPDFDVHSWVGLLAPAGTAPAIVERLHKETAAVLALPDVRERLAALGIEPVGNTPREFAAQIRSELMRWAKVVKAAKIELE
jgi:tripartite-type tricarboxylate transporter receptor subunit TctC